MAYRYIRQEAWAQVAHHKGQVSSVLCPQRDTGAPESISAAIADWQVGDRALLLHTYGGIGGDRKEPAAFSPIFFGHFAYGRAEVVHDPLADERRFEIRYYQVYAHNNDFNLGSSLEDTPLRNLVMGLGSWRTVLPRKASDVVVRQFLRFGASVWVLRTSQLTSSPCDPIGYAGRFLGSPQRFPASKGAS